MKTNLEKAFELFNNKYKEVTATFFSIEDEIYFETLL